jgi:hypothetical protein
MIKDPRVYLDDILERVCNTIQEDILMLKKYIQSIIRCH